MWEDQYEHDCFSDEFDTDDEVELEEEDDEECESVDSVAELLLECESYSGDTESNLAAESHICCLCSSVVLMQNGDYKECSEIVKGDWIWTNMGYLEVLQCFCCRQPGIECFCSGGVCGNALLSADCENWYHTSESQHIVQGAAYFIVTCEPLFAIFNGTNYVQIDNTKLRFEDAHTICGLQFTRAVNGCITEVVLMSCSDLEN